MDRAGEGASSSEVVELLTTMAKLLRPSGT
jgi:hypothetical protein